jgi:hypothetical protein
MGSANDIDVFTRENSTAKRKRFARKVFLPLISVDETLAAAKHLVYEL